MLLATSVLLYFLAPSLIFLVLQPISMFIPASDGVTMASNADLAEYFVSLKPLEGFALKFKVALVFSIVVCCPIWIWQILGFFMPALKPNERKWVIPTFFAAITLFVCGALFCYTLILAPAFEWLIGQTSDIAGVMGDVGEYVNVILLFEIGFGIAFELPLIVFYLTIFNIVPYKKLRASWRVVYIVLLIVCAMVTPDANPITMILMFAAMAVLYEGSLFLSRIVLARRIKRQKLEDDEDVQDEDSESEDEEK